MIYTFLFTAQITQWDLIFHGTEEPTQPDDPPRYLKTSLEAQYGNEMEHNSLEFEADAPSGQWRDNQEVNTFLDVLAIVFIVIYNFTNSKDRR